MPLNVEIVTPERRVLQTTCDELRAPGELGGFGIRPGHASFMTSLQPGRLTIVSGGHEDHYAVSGGFLQVDKDRVIVLADSAEARAEIDLDAAKRDFAEATERLRSMTEQDAGHSVESARVRRATARITVGGK